MSAPLVLATFQTRHYDFTVVAESEEAARTAMARAWEVHCDQVPGAFRNVFSQDDVNVTPITPGVVLRDGRPL